MQTTTQMYGGVGKDTLTGAHGAVNDGQALNGHISVAGGRIKIQPTPAADTIHIHKNVSPQLIEITLNGVLTSYAAGGQSGIDIAASDGNNVIDLQSAGLAAKVYGGAGNDHIYGSGMADRNYGGAGNEWINGGAGNDTLYGEAGNDRLFGDQGRDFSTAVREVIFSAAAAGSIRSSRERRSTITKAIRTTSSSWF